MAHLLCAHKRRVSFSPTTKRVRHRQDESLCDKPQLTFDGRPVLTDAILEVGASVAVRTSGEDLLHDIFEAPDA